MWYINKIYNVIASDKQLQEPIWLFVKIILCEMDWDNTITLNNVQ